MAQSIERTGVNLNSGPENFFMLPSALFLPNHGWHAIALENLLGVSLYGPNATRSAGPCDRAALHRVSANRVSACRSVLQRCTWAVKILTVVSLGNCFYRSARVNLILQGAEHLPYGKEDSKLLRELSGNAGGHHL